MKWSEQKTTNKVESPFVSASVQELTKLRSAMQKLLSDLQGKKETVTRSIEERDKNNG